MVEFIEIVEFVFSNPNCRNKDIISFLIDSTLKKERKQSLERNINRKLTKLKNNKTIVFNPILKHPHYKINPHIKDINKDWRLQIKEGEKKAIKLLLKAKKQEKQFEKSVDFSLAKESELRKRIMENISFSFKFKNEKLNKGIVFEKETKELQENLVYSLIRNGFLFSPETWKMLNNLDFLNFEFIIKSNLSKDAKIFDLYNELKENFRNKGRIFHSFYAPFNRVNSIELPKEKNNEIEDIFHEKAFYYDKFEEKRLIEKKNKIENELRVILNSGSKLLKIIRQLEIEAFDSEKFGDLNEFFDKIKDLDSINTYNEILGDLMNFKNIFIDLIKKIEIKE